MKTLASILAVAGAAVIMTAGPSAAEPLRGCFTVGDFPAAETRELLAQAIEAKAAGNDELLRQLRTTQKVLSPHATAVEGVQCLDDGSNFCTIQLWGKTLLQHIVWSTAILSVEQGTENPRVGSSILSLGTSEIKPLW